MILSQTERREIYDVIIDIEKIAESQPQHSATRQALYRNTAALKTIINKAPVTSDHRGQPVK